MPGMDWSIRMDNTAVKAYFESEPVVEHYADAAVQLGLWVSEEKIYTRLFKKEDSLLELGCGAGRIALGLYELGYRNILATDYAKAMVERLRKLSQLLEYAIPSQVADATALDLEDGVFDGAIFGFNGLMQIPGRRQRESALLEIHRVLCAGAWFTFTTHDRELSPHREFWRAEEQRWLKGEQSPELEVLGDRFEVMADGSHYMHVPTVAEMESLLEGTGFRIEASVMRSELGEEPPEVQAFSDDCRFWVVQKV